MTQELLEARLQELEAKQQELRRTQAVGAAEIERIQRQVNRARDEENVVGGALQEARHWWGVLEQERLKAPKEV